jgi:hypothetical protein
MNKKHKLWLIFFAVFAAGVLLGIGGGYLIGKAPRGRRFPPERGVVKRRFIDDLDRHVKLDDKQKADIVKIMDAHFNKLKEFQKQIWPKMQELQKQFLLDVQAQLKPEQSSDFEKFKKELQERVRRHKGRKRGPGKGKRDTKNFMDRRDKRPHEAGAPPEPGMNPPRPGSAPPPVEDKVKPESGNALQTPEREAPVPTR